MRHQGQDENSVQDAGGRMTSTLPTAHDGKRRDLDTPGRRARREWTTRSKRADLEAEQRTLKATLAILESNLAMHEARGDVGRANQTRHAINNCQTRIEKARIQLAALERPS